MTFHACDGLAVSTSLDADAPRATSPFDHHEYFDRATPHGYHRLSDVLRVDDSMDPVADAGFTSNPDDEAEDDDRPAAPAPAPVQAAEPAPACAPALRLPDAPCSAINADDVTPAELGIVDNRDRPLTWHWRTNEADEKIMAAAGILPTGDADYNRLMFLVVTELVRTGDIDPGLWVSISRNKNKYGSKSKAPRFVTRDRMVTLLADLDGRGLLEEQRAEQGKAHRKKWKTPQGKYMTGYQSRYRATPRLMEAFRSVTQWHHEAGENVLRMKDKDNKAVLITETTYVARLAAPARAYNAMMRQHVVELVSQDARCNRTRIEVDHIGLDGKTYTQVVCPTPTVVVFRSYSRGKFTKGGRFYHAFQALSKKLRGQLLIDGEEVVELDYKALHPSMLYAMRGLPIPAECYDVPGVDEKSAKAALLVMISASSRQGAVEALLAKADDKRPWRHDKRRTWAILKAMEAAHVPILPDLYQDKGIDLMNIDGRMTAWVLTQCAQMDLPCLPVHDSYIPKARQEAEMRDLMERAWGRFFKGSCPRITGGVLEKSYKASVCIPRPISDEALQTLPSPSFLLPPGSLPVLPAAVEDNLDLQDNLPCVGVGAHACMCEAPGEIVETLNVGERACATVSPQEVSVVGLQTSQAASRPVIRMDPRYLASLKAQGQGMETSDRRVEAMSLVSRQEVVPGLYRASGSVQTRLADLAAIRLNPRLRAAIARSVSQDLPAVPGLPRMDPGTRAMLQASGKLARVLQEAVRPGASP